MLYTYKAVCSVIFVSLAFSAVMQSVMFMLSLLQRHEPWGKVGMVTGDYHY